MTVKEYNKEFLPKIDHATGFIHNLEHAMQKTDDYDGAMKQINCIGWSDELKETIFTALEFYRSSVLKNNVEISEVNKGMNEFKLETELNADTENVGFLLVSQIGTREGKPYRKEHNSYYTESLNKQFVIDSISDFINNKLK